MTAPTWDELRAQLPKTPAERHIARTIALMHTAHGRLEGHSCGECRAFVRKPADTSGNYWKCAAFLRDHPVRSPGSWGSAATDWRVTWQACGKWEGRQ